MSLVDYGSSSEDEEDDKLLREEANQNKILHLFLKTSSTISSMDKLLDASFLLNSPTFPSTMASSSDHSSRVAAAMAESASRKRVANEPTSSFPRAKVPRGRVTHTKNVPETVGGLVVPPQVKGSVCRSNVVAEDIGKLSVRWLSDPSSLQVLKQLFFSTSC